MSKKPATYHKPGSLTDAQRALLDLYGLYWMHISGIGHLILISSGPINDYNKAQVIVSTNTPIESWVRELETHRLITPGLAG